MCKSGRQNNESTFGYRHFVLHALFLSLEGVKNMFVPIFFTEKIVKRAFGGRKTNQEKITIFFLTVHLVGQQIN